MKLPHLVGVLCLASFATIVGFAQQGAPAAPGAPAAAATPPLPPPRGTLTIGSEADAAIKAGVQAPPGFIVTAFAAPPVVNYPTCVTATHDGVVFVCVDRNGSLQADPGMGYIVRLVDKDQNGQADEYSVFAALDSPRGAVFDGEALYVSHPPFVTALRDADGDGIAEDRRTLVRGLGFGLDFRGADHTTNGLEMGIDGWLYIAVGDYGAVKAVGADGQEIQMRGGGNVRVRPDGTDLEIYSRGTRNDYDLAIDPYLNLFARGNTNDGGGFDIRLYHFVAGANFGYPTLFRNFSDEVVPPLADYGTGSGTGMLFVHDAGLPAPYGNALYSVDWGRNAIFRHPLQPKGSTFAAQQEPFITVTRPNDITVDGSSRMYVASWAGGQFRYAGENVGYVARLTHEKATPVRPENLAAATDARLVEIIASANLVQSRAAQSTLVRRGVSAERLSLLERRATTATGPLHGRVAAIFTLKQMAGPAATATLVKMVADSTVRAFALRALADRRAELADVPKSLFVTALADKDPRVQLEAISGLKRLGATDAAAAMLPLTASADVVVSNVAINALAELAAIDAPLAALTQPSDAVAKGALRVLQQIHQPAVVTGLLARLPDVVTVERRALMLQALARLHYREGVWRGTLPEWWGTRPDTTGPYYDPVAWEESARIRAVLTNELMRSASGASSQVNPARFLTDLERNRLLPPGGAELLTALAADRHQLLGETARVLMGRVRLDVDAPTAQVFDRVARVNMRYRASVAKLVVAAGSPTPAAGALLLAAVGDVALPTDVRAAALTALASATGPDAARRAIDAFALVVAPTLEAPLETAWGQFIGSQAHATNVSTFRELTEAMDAAKQRLGYSVLLRLAADPPPAAVAGGARGGGGGGGGGGRGAGAPAAPGAGAAATAPALPGAGAGAAPAAAPAAGRGAPAAAAAVAGGAPAGAAAGAARGGGAAGGRGGGGRGGRGGVSEAVLQTARSEARATIDRGWDSPSAANLVWAVGRTGAVQYRDRVEALSASPRADVLESVTYARARFAALTPATPPPTAAAAAGPVVSSIAFDELAGRLATVTGNAAAGRAIFERQACAACHTTAAGEPEKGPYLGGIFTRYSRAEVLESILRPAAKVAQGFATNSFTTTDNRQLTGFVIREGQDDVVIRDLTGAETTLRKSLISSRSVSEGSVMPPGLVDTITLQELASLLAFLESTAAK